MRSGFRVPGFGFRVGRIKSKSKKQRPFWPLLLLLTVTSNMLYADMLCDHEVVIENGRLQPWTSYDNILRWSMNYIKHCPTRPTRFGEDPWYLITSKINEDGTFMANQNNQGSNALYAVDTLIRYYAFTGDREPFACVELLLDRLLYYRTPREWAWPGVPRTQDNSPDGEYTDVTSEVDKICMVGTACAEYYQLTGKRKYLRAARAIADLVAGRIEPGDADKSPLPFRVNLKTGKVVEQYTSNMVAAVAFFQALIDMGEDHDGKYAGARDVLWKWVVAFPMKSNRWSGYYEDVGNHPDNYNQQLPLETARFMLRHPDFEAQYKQYVPALIEWARDRFGQTRQFGATSIREQDCCFYEMSSHTARYASVAAKWFGVSGKAEDREEARASFAVATYSVKNKFSKGDDALNYVGIGYTKPWFSDSYFDYLTHIIEGMAELPEMSPADQDHLLGSTSVVQSIKYAPGRVRYRTRDKHGCEILRLSFTPKVETKKHGLRYEFGEYRGVSNVLRVWRAGTDRVSINRE